MWQLIFLYLLIKSTGVVSALRLWSFRWGFSCCFNDCLTSHSFLSLISPVSGYWSAQHQPGLILHFALARQSSFVPPQPHHCSTTAPCLDKLIPTQPSQDCHLKISLLTSLSWLPLKVCCPHAQTGFLLQFSTQYFFFLTLGVLSSSTIFWFLASRLCIVILCHFPLISRKHTVASLNQIDFCQAWQIFVHQTENILELKEKTLYYWEIYFLFLCVILGPLFTTELFLFDILSDMLYRLFVYSKHGF